MGVPLLLYGEGWPGNAIINKVPFVSLYVRHIHGFGTLDTGRRGPRRLGWPGIRDIGLFRRVPLVVHQRND